VGDKPAPYPTGTDRSPEDFRNIDQHLNSPAHALLYKCDECDECDDCDECDECDRPFGSKQALEQHLNSPAHRFECDQYDRSFGSLEQHLNCPLHNAIIPLEVGQPLHWQR
jgi:Zinc-finger double-stranded RNA-binding